MYSPLINILSSRYPDTGGCFKVQLCCPYIVINKTGLPFAVRPWRTARLGSSQDVAGDTRPGKMFPEGNILLLMNSTETMAQPLPFSMCFILVWNVATKRHSQCCHILPGRGKTSASSSESRCGRRQARSTFIPAQGLMHRSQRVGLEAPSAETRLLIPSQVHNNEEIHIGLSWAEGLGKYKLTKVITLTPRFILRNNSKSAIAFREHGAAPRGRAVLDAGERSPLHFLRMGDEKLMTIASLGPNAQW